MSCAVIPVEWNGFFKPAAQSIPERLSCGKFSGDCVEYGSFTFKQGQLLRHIGFFQDCRKPLVCRTFRNYWSHNRRSARISALIFGVQRMSLRGSIESAYYGHFELPT